MPFVRISLPRYSSIDKIYWKTIIQHGWLDYKERKCPSKAPLICIPAYFFKWNFCSLYTNHLCWVIFLRHVSPASYQVSLLSFSLEQFTHGLWPTLFTSFVLGKMGLNSKAWVLLSLPSWGIALCNIDLFNVFLQLPQKDAKLKEGIDSFPEPPWGRTTWENFS